MASDIIVNNHPLRRVVLTAALSAWLPVGSGDSRDWGISITALGEIDITSVHALRQCAYYSFDPDTVASFHKHE